MVKRISLETEEIKELQRRLREAETALLHFRERTSRNAQIAQESENDFRSLAENVHEGIVVASATGEIFYTNPQFAKLLGYAPNELTQLNIKDIVPEDEFPTVQERALARLAGLPVPSHYEISLRHRNGNVIPCFVSATRTTWQGKPAVAGFIHDITDRRQMEQALAWEIRAHQALNELSRHLLTSVSLEDISNVVLEQAKLLTASPYGFVGYLDKEGQLVLDTLTSEVAGLCELNLEKVKFEHMSGLWGWVIEHGQPAWSNFHNQDPRAGVIPPGHLPIQRIAAAPAKQNEKVVGIVAVANAIDLYTVKHIEFLERLGDLYAVALHHCQADEMIVQETRRANTLAHITETLITAGLDTHAILNLIVQQSAETLNATSAIFFTENPSQAVFDFIVYDADPTMTTLIENALRQTPIEEGNQLIQQVLDTGEPIWLADANSDEIYPYLSGAYRAVVELVGLSSLMFAPIKSPHGILGVLAAAKHQGKQKFTEHDFTFLQEIAYRAAIALTNAQFYQELQAQHKMLEQRVAERTAELQRERDFAHLVMNTVGQGLTVVDANHRFVYVNPAFANTIGYQPEELIGKTTKEITHSGDQETLDLQWEKRKAGQTSTYENRLIHKDGSLVPVLITGVPRFQDGEFVGTIAAITDMREQKRLLERQKWLQAFRDTLLSIAQAFIAATDENLDEILNQVLSQLGQFIQADRSYIFLIDWKTDRMSNTHEWCADGISPEISNLQNIPNASIPMWMESLKQPYILIPSVKDLQPSWRVMQDFFEAESIQSLLCVPIRAKDHLFGFVGFDSVKSQRIWQEDEISLLTILANHLASLFERQSAEKALKESESRYRLLAENVFDVIVAFDFDFNVHYISPSILRLSGYTAGEITEKHFFELLTPTSYENFKHFVSMELSKERLKTITPENASPKTIELEFIHKDQTLRWIEVKANFIFDSVGKPQELICSIRDISERRQASQILEYMATHDPLTGLPNRTLFKDRLEHALKRAERLKYHVAVLLIDLDHFKQINDTLGHLKGDEVLQDVSRRLLSCLRESDTVARMGGDEFTIILENISTPASLKTLAQKILDILRVPYELEETTWALTASMGISIYPTDGRDMESLFRCADIAMYRAKRRRNRYRFYSPLTSF